MCGIAGIIVSNSKRYEREINSAVAALRLRGPDGQGTHYFNNCVLGHTRLSIVDLTTGQQPMIGANSNLAITFNGEIYGYKQIKSTLSDYAFITTSDTEVILALYQKYGVECLSKLPGMFAFAIWDVSKQKLFAARDRFGEKPFYYAYGSHNEFIFASEIKAILATGLIEPKIDKQSLAHYLRRLYVHPHKTIYSNIFTLPPAHYLQYSNNKIGVKRYWQLPQINSAIKLDEASEQFKILLDKSIQKQLVADVPVGAFLSGGLDSTSIVAVASKFKQSLKTISFGFQGGLNELPYARTVSAYYKTDHTQLYAKDYNIGDLLEKMVAVYDEPFADSSNIPTYLISEMAKKLCTVVLTGDGGDELFGGYANWYRPLNFKDNLLAGVMRLLSNINNPRSWIYLSRAVGYKISGQSIMELHNRQNSYFNDTELSRLLDAAPLQPGAYSWTPTNTLDDAMRLDVENYMPGDILVKTDRAAMANGLELRAPFLDVDFASFCLSLPFQLKITNTEDKYILRRALAEVWPSVIRFRGKQGFGAPVKKWLRDSAVKKLKTQYLKPKNSKIYNLVSYEATQKFIKEDSYQAWALLALAMWAEKHSYSI